MFKKENIIQHLLPRLCLAHCTYSTKDKDMSKKQNEMTFIYFVEINNEI